MNRTEKEQVIGELHEKMAKAKAAIVAEPRGLTVAVVTELRKKLRDAKVEYRVVKNTLVKIALKGTAYDSAELAWLDSTQSCSLSSRDG